MKRCGVCRNPYRGKARYVVALAPEPRRVLACGECVAMRTALVLVEGTATPCRCGSVALLCVSCAGVDRKRERAQQLAGALKLIDDKRRAYLRAPQGVSALDQGELIAEGLRVAADLIKTGDWPDAGPA